MKKKTLLLLLVLLLLTACNINNKEINKEDNTIKKESKIEEKKEEYIDNNPIKLGIYMYYNSYTNRKKTNEYNTSWELNVDLCSLEIFYTNEDSIPGTKIKNLWTDYKNKYDNIDNYKIGYNINFDTKNEGTINKTILNPSDTWDIYNYLQVYLYDDIHQEDNAWYSHVTDEEYNDSTILSSIKLTGSTIVDEITSDITLTAFTYDEDDFDDNNNYRGISKDTIIIKRS